MRPPALILAAFSALAIAGQTSTPVTLRRTFKQGAVEKYTTVVTNESESSPVPMDFKVTTETQRTYNKVDDKGAEYAVESLSIKVEPETGTPPSKSHATGHISPRGIVSNQVVTTDGAPSGAMAMMTAATQGENPDGVVLPEKAVKPGDTWTFTPGGMKAMNAEGDYVFTFRGEKELDGKAYWYITGTGSFNMKGNAGGDLTDAASVAKSMKGTIEQTIEAYLDKTDLSVVKSVNKGTTNMTVPGIGMEVSLRTTVTQTKH